MRLFLYRYQKSDKQIIGKLYVLDDNDASIVSYDSLELPWKNNKRRVSCIPEGKYKAIKHNSPKHGLSLWLQDVPGRSEILIHKGNFYYDILGCILVGLDLDDINNDNYLDVINSKAAIKDLMSVIADLDSIDIEIQ